MLVIFPNKTSTRAQAHLSPSLSVSALQRSEMAEKGEEESPAISPSVSGEKSDSGQDPSDPPTPDEDPGIFRQQEEEKKEEKEEEEEEEEEEGEKEEEEEGEKEEEDSEIFHQSKRRKKCPAALEKSLSSNRGFSFSFDTKIVSGGQIGSTPKFGSFNLGLIDGTDCEGIGLGLGLGLGFHGEKREGGEEEGEAGSKHGI